MKGTVKWYDEKKGYGFVRPIPRGKDIFINFTALRSAGVKGLPEGQAIEFDVETTDRGNQVSNLRLA